MENTNTQNDFKRIQTTANWYEMKLEIMQKKNPKQINQLKVSKKGGKVIKQQQKPTNYKIKTNYYKEVQNDYKTKIKLYKRTTSTYHQRWAVTR